MAKIQKKDIEKRYTSTMQRCVKVFSHPTRLEIINTLREE